LMERRTLFAGSTRVRTTVPAPVFSLIVPSYNSTSMLSKSDTMRTIAGWSLTFTTVVAAIP
jgi:hypothetical protein